MGAPFSPYFKKIGCASELLKQAWYFSRLSLYFKKIGCASELLKQAWYFPRLSPYFKKIGCASELLKQVWYFSRLSLYLIFKKNEYVSKISGHRAGQLDPLRGESVALVCKRSGDVSGHSKG